MFEIHAFQGRSMGPGEPFENTEIEILLVEDNEGDARLVKEAFKTSKFHWHLTVVQDGVEALMCLNGLGRYAGGEKPKLVLLDLKLPKLNGFEVLAEMRRNLSLKKIPVIILTGSQSEEDMEEAHKLEADLFLTKPMNPAGYPGLVQTVKDFCLKSFGG